MVLDDIEKKIIRIESNSSFELVRCQIQELEISKEWVTFYATRDDMPAHGVIPTTPDIEDYDLPWQFTNVASDYKLDPIDDKVVASYVSFKANRLLHKGWLNLSVKAANSLKNLDLVDAVILRGEDYAEVYSLRRVGDQEAMNFVLCTDDWEPRLHQASRTLNRWMMTVIGTWWLYLVLSELLVAGTFIPLDFLFIRGFWTVILLAVLPVVIIVLWPLFKAYPFEKLRRTILRTLKQTITTPTPSETSDASRHAVDLASSAASLDGHHIHQPEELIIQADRQVAHEYRLLIERMSIRHEVNQYEKPTLLFFVGLMSPALPVMLELFRTMAIGERVPFDMLGMSACAVIFMVLLLVGVWWINRDEWQQQSIMPDELRHIDQSKVPKVRVEYTQYRHATVVWGSGERDSLRQWFIIEDLNGDYHFFFYPWESWPSSRDRRLPPFKDWRYVTDHWANYRTMNFTGLLDRWEGDRLPTTYTNYVLSEQESDKMIRMRWGSSLSMRQLSEPFRGASTFIRDVLNRASQVPVEPEPEPRQLLRHIELPNDDNSD